MTTVHPEIAIVSSNMLTDMGLAGIVRSMMPGAEACLFTEFDELCRKDKGQFYHYFISVPVLVENARYFLERRHKTIVLIQGEEDTGRLPQDFHTLNICQSEDRLTRDFLMLARTAHGPHRSQPEAFRKASEQAPKTLLTPRETEVLRLVASGLINKEIAARMGISLTTVISHRKNLTEKLGIKSVSGLTVYAVMHGLVELKDI